MMILFTSAAMIRIIIVILIACIFSTWVHCSMLAVSRYVVYRVCSR